MIGRRAGRSRGLPAASNPASTCGAASSGSTRPIGWSSSIRPASTSCIAATEVTALVIEAMRKIVSGVIALPCGEIAPPEGALVENPVRGRRQRHDPRHLAGLGGMAQQRVDFGNGCHRALLSAAAATRPSPAAR